MKIELRFCEILIAPDVALVLVCYKTFATKKPFEEEIQLGGHVYFPIRTTTLPEAEFTISLLHDKVVNSRIACTSNFEFARWSCVFALSPLPYVDYAV